MPATPQSPDAAARALRLRRLRAGPTRDRASRPAARTRPRRDSSSASGNRQTSDSYPSTSNTSTPRTRPRCRRPRSRPPPTEPRWPRKPGSESQSLASRGGTDLERDRQDRRGAQRQPDRARLPPPHAASSGTCSAASPPPSSPTRQPPCSSCTSNREQHKRVCSVPHSGRP